MVINAMCEYLPKGNCKWNAEEWTIDKILNLVLEVDYKKGYMFDVHLHYPNIT